MESSEIKQVSVIKVKQNTKNTLLDYVAEEKELDFFLEDSFLNKFYTTPKKLKELLIGFCASEGIINPYKESLEILFQEKNKNLLIAKAKIRKEKAFIFKKNHTQEPKVTTKEIFHFSEIFDKKSYFFHKTGCFHVAAVFKCKELLAVNEDIGRYNAIDKVIGKLLSQQISPEGKILVVSCRIFKKILSKVQKLGIKLVISKGAPTYEAVEFAHFHDITLIGFLKRDRFNIYTHAWRIKDE